MGTRRAPLPDSRRADDSRRRRDADRGRTAPGHGRKHPGYKLFRVAAVLTIDAGSAVGQARVRCRTDVPGGRSSRRPPDSRAAYPRSSSGEDLLKQDLPGEVVRRVPLPRRPNAPRSSSATPSPSFTNQPGVVGQLGPLQQALQEWQWGLPEGRPEEPLELGFASFWRTTTPPTARISCTVETGAGTATVRTGGQLDSSARARRGRPAAPGLRSLSDLVQLRVGGGARHPRRGQRGAHRDRVLGLRSGRSQAASASGLGRIAGIRSCTLATTSFGVVVTIVQL